MLKDKIKKNGLNLWKYLIKQMTMNIKLVYRDQDLGNAWKKYFNGIDNVEIINEDICQTTCDAIVSPANSFGFMDGGLDYYLSERFGWELEKELQQQIKNRPMRELLVGEALIIPTKDDKVPWLISSPTMRVPMRLRQSVNAYLAMKAILHTALSFKEKPAITTIAIPGLGTGCGALDAETAALQMWQAYKEIVLKDFTYPEDFGKAQKRHFLLNEKEINIWDA